MKTQDMGFALIGIGGLTGAVYVIWKRFQTPDPIPTPTPLPLPVPQELMPPTPTPIEPPYVEPTPDEPVIPTPIPTPIVPPKDDPLHDDPLPTVPDPVEPDPIIHDPELNVIWTFPSAGMHTRFIPEVYPEVFVFDTIEFSVPKEVQGVYWFDDVEGEWIFWAPGAPGTTLEQMTSGTLYKITVTGPCTWAIPI